MPRLIADASNFTFLGGIAENEAVFSAMGHEPLLNRRILLLLVQQLIILVHDVYCQPSLVLCDTNTLNSLPADIFRDGCAEVIKYGLLNNAPFFNDLMETPAKEQYEHVISTCVEMKKQVVLSDEFDRGERQKLNLGHTIGHAVEQCSGFTLLHGECVAIGMAVITRAAVKKGFCAQETLDAVEKILKLYGLPDKTDYSADKLLDVALSDKKVANGNISLIVPEAVGKCSIRPVPAEALREWMQAGGIV